AVLRRAVRRPPRHRRATVRGPAVVAAAAPARSGCTGRHPLGSRRQPESRRPGLQPEPGRPSVLRDRAASGRVADRAAVRSPGAGVQFAPAVRVAARRWTLREDAEGHARTRHRAAGLDQPQPGRFRRRQRNPSVQRSRGRTGMDMPAACQEGAMTVQHAPLAAGFSRIAPCSGTAVELDTGDELIVVDPLGQQVSDLTAFARDDLDEYLSSGRSIDYASRLWLTTDDVLYSNRSRPMFTIVEDSCGRHDFTLTPCSKRMFELLYDEKEGRPGCEGNLAAALAPYGIGVDRIPVAFNIFM